LLSLTIEDVWQNRAPVFDLLFEKDIVKGKETARMIPVNSDGQKAIRELIAWHIERYGEIDPQTPLFPSRKNGTALSRSQAHRILSDAFAKAGLNGKLATHSLRKTFAQRIYDASGDIFLVKELLGHKNVKTTQQYLGVSYAKMWKRRLLRI
ncbi:MAG: tyrosine-type recombinase/integrase, partial [Candidatus Ranarchaeia archaeon]